VTTPTPAPAMMLLSQCLSAFMRRTPMVALTAHADPHAMPCHTSER